MDRNILTTGEQFDASDMCQTNKNAYVGLAKAACAILGTSTLLNGFTCTQTPTPSMQVIVGPGEIYQMAATDTTAYGDLPTDSHQILKQGVNLDALPANTFTFAAPATAGQSVNYLLEFQLQEQDIDTENREFFGGAAMPVPTIRQDSVYVKQLVGTPAATGSQVTPTPEAGFVGGFVITIANGQTSITNSNISVYPGAPFITETLTQKISQTTGDARYAQLAAANTFTQIQTMPALVARVALASTVTVPSGNIAFKINYDTVEFDAYSLWDSTNKRYNISKLGYWRLHATLYGSAVTVGEFYIGVFVNGTLYKRLNEVSGMGEDITLSGGCLVKVTTTNTLIEIYAYHDSADPVTSIGDTSLSYFELEYVGT